MPKYVITITENGAPVGYVGRVAVHFDSESDRLRSDYPVAEDVKDAMTYLTRELAEQFAESFNKSADGEVDFHVTELAAPKPAVSSTPASPDASVPQSEASGKRRSGFSEAVRWLVGRFKR